MTERIIHLSKRAKDLTEQRFGMLVAKYPTRKSMERVRWFCLCDCGGSNYVVVASLISGKTKSCGCHQYSGIIGHNTSHGMSNTPTYHAWLGMKSRCNAATKYDKHHNYSGRGITVCTQWVASFETFLADMGECPSTKHSIDRTNNDGGYTPENCQWATATEQVRNRRNTRTLTYRGETRPLAEWAETTGIPYKTIAARIKRGWSTEMTLEEPLQVQYSHPNSSSAE